MLGAGQVLPGFPLVRGGGFQTCFCLNLARAFFADGTFQITMAGIGPLNFAAILG
jgi:hypothetical protein